MRTFMCTALHACARDVRASTRVRPDMRVPTCVHAHVRARGDACMCVRLSTCVTRPQASRPILVST